MWKNAQESVHALVRLKDLEGIKSLAVGMGLWKEIEINENYVTRVVNRQVEKKELVAEKEGEEGGKQN